MASVQRLVVTKLKRQKPQLLLGKKKRNTNGPQFIVVRLNDFSMLQWCKSNMNPAGNHTSNFEFCSLPSLAMYSTILSSRWAAAVPEALSGPCDHEGEQPTHASVFTVLDDSAQLWANGGALSMFMVGQLSYEFR